MKKVLFLVKNIDEINEAIKFVEVLQKKFSYMESHVLYIRDVMKYDMMSTNIEGISVQGTINVLLKEYSELEKENFNLLEQKMKNKFQKIYSLEGDSVEIVLEELKSYDLLVVVKSKELSSTMKELLRYHYKPMIILSKTNEEYIYNIDKILMLNDGGYKANKSVFSYFNLFKEENIDILRVNVEEDEKLIARFGKICNVINKTGDKNSIILDMIKDYGFIIMGDLQFSVFFEKIAGNVGIKVIENSLSPIFIG